MRIFLDDLRNPEEVQPAAREKWDLIVRNTSAALVLVTYGLVDFIDFDHDMGDGVDGVVVAQFIERRAAQGKQPPDYRVHSQNPVGAENIHAAMSRARKFWGEWQLSPPIKE